LIEWQEMPKTQDISTEYLEQQLYLQKIFSNIFTGAKLDQISFDTIMNDSIHT
jgi:hypothetical protein